MSVRAHVFKRTRICAQGLDLTDKPLVLGTQAGVAGLGSRQIPAQFQKAPIPGTRIEVIRHIAEGEGQKTQPPAHAESRSFLSGYRDA